MAVNYNILDFELDKEILDLAIHNQVLGFVLYGSVHF